MANIKVLSLNCRVWTRDRDKTSPYYWRTRMEKIAEMIREQSPDILCLQELIYPATRYIPKEYKRVTWGVSHSIWMKRSIFTDHYGWGWRIFADYADFGHFDNSTFRIINVHSRWNDGIIKKVTKQINGKIRPYTIAVGDFNAEAEKYSKMGIKMRNKAIGEDTFQNPTKPESHGEIDLCFRTDLVRIKSIGIASQELMSDHKPILIEADVW